MKVLVGVCGGIAAYKAAELVRVLQRASVDVTVAMTTAAERFVTPLTFAALTGRTVITSLWQASGESFGNASSFDIEHITAGKDVDAVVIAPATANMISKLAHGIADDFLSTTCLATRARIVLAPAMNVNMWQHSATQENVRILTDRGAILVPPDDGYLACGMVGDGRLAPVDAIAEQVLLVGAHRFDLLGEQVLITAGGTREPIDPVRFIGNRSSGKMGHALAEAALARGASVHLVTASPLPVPAGCTFQRVSTAAEMAVAAKASLAQKTIVIGAAAVSDFRVNTVATDKLRRADALKLELQPTEDIIADIAANRSPDMLVIAFAAETEELETRAREKLIRKGVDAVVANDVAQEHIGFDSDRNAALFVTAEKSVQLSECTKRVLADRIFDQVTELRCRADGGSGPRAYVGARDALV